MVLNRSFLKEILKGVPYTIQIAVKTVIKLGFKEIQGVA